MVVDVVERRLAQQLEAGPDHPRDPEEVDVAPRRADVARVEGLEVRRLLRPPQSRERPERGREPRVEHVLFLRQLRLAALGARGGLRLRNDRVPVGAVPDRDPVPPPELARDAPGADVLEVGEHDLGLLLGVRAHAAIAGRRRSPASRARPCPPTTGGARAARSGRPSGRSARPSAGTAPASRSGHAPRAAPRSAAPLRPESARRTRPPRRSFARRGRSPSAPEDSWSRPISQSIASWPGVIFTAPVPNSGIDALVGDDRHAALGDRHDRLLPDEVRVTRVIRVHRNRDVGEHRRRPHGRDRHVALAVSERIADPGQRVVELAVPDLEIGDGARDSRDTSSRSASRGRCSPCPRGGAKNRITERE